MRTIKVDALETTYVRLIVDEGKREVSAEVVGWARDLSVELETLWKTAKGMAQGSITDYIARALWSKYNVVSVSWGFRETSYDGSTRIHIGTTKSFLREAETKVEGTTKLEVMTKT